ncbi:hypothetical protein SSX86_005259 [Deinandra increscens subsp. villosa]|uniref:Protein kinase domain-containing protein n=1 Tax=Deinandra increscens subsp. villosa TaxID=3103831 RepID=A0AAP0DL57_9ASTR
MFVSTGYNNESELSTTLKWLEPCRRFEFHEILSATENFDESLVIGSGGFGKVYKGNIVNGLNTVVAAFKRLDPTSNQGPPEFWAEVETLSRLRHSHLVSLIGYCSYGKEMILVYEYMPNGTLHEHLHKLYTPLSWLQRLKISHKCGSWVRLPPHWHFWISGPYYVATGKLSWESDVYAFGVVLLEVLCRKSATDGDLDWGIATWARDSIKEGRLKHIIDFDISDQISQKCLKRFVRITERCLDNYPKQRPTMSEVVSTLESVLNLQEKEKTNNLFQTAAGKTMF